VWWHKCVTNQRLETKRPSAAPMNGMKKERKKCGLPYYCATLVRVPDVLGELAVWWHALVTNKQTSTSRKNKN